MKIWFTRFLTAVFVISMLMSPQLTTFATDDSLSEDVQAPVLNDDVNVDDGLDAGDDDSGSADNGEGDGTNPTDNGDSTEPDANGDQSDESNDDGESQGEDAGSVDNGQDDGEGSSDGGSGESGEATDANEADEDESADDGNGDNGNESNGDDDSSTDVLAAPASDIGPLVRITDGITLTTPSYDADTEILTIPFRLDAGLTAEAGDFISISVRVFRDATMTGLSSPSVSGDLFDISIGGSVDSPNIRLEFKADYPAQVAKWESVEVKMPLTWIACDPDAMSSYDRDARIVVNHRTGAGSVDTLVPGESCEGHGNPTIDDVQYVPAFKSLVVELQLPSAQFAGSVATINYPPDQIALAAGNYQVLGTSYPGARDVVLGTATVTEGLVTINFDFDDPNADLSSWARLFIPATIIAEECGPGVGLVLIEDITYIANPGGTFTDEFGEIMCDAAPMTKTGIWLNETDIEWTIDSGELLGHSYVEDYWTHSVMNVDCSQVTIEYASGYGDGAEEPVLDYCSQWSSFGVYLEGDIVHRVIITYTTSIYADDPETSYLNCVESWKISSDNDIRAAQVSSTGYGDMACYELFPEDAAGDTLSKVVDKSEVESGDTVTYTVEVSTSSDSWSSITVTDALPTGFEIDESSVTCSVMPDHHEVGGCYTLVDNQLTVVALSIPGEGWSPDTADPVDITLTFSGVISGDPGDVIANEACSERIYQNNTQMPLLVSGDPTIPGGGVICETAMVTIIGDDPVETPTQTPPPPTTVPTETPTAPATPTETAEPSETPTEPATPGATPTTTVSPDPEDPKSVTGLPSTGSGGSGTSAMFIAAIAASLLIAGVVGIRMRPSH